LSKRRTVTSNRRAGRVIRAGGAGRVVTQRRHPHASGVVSRRETSRTTNRPPARVHQRPIVARPGGKMHCTYRNPRHCGRNRRRVAGSGAQHARPPFRCVTALSRNVRKLVGVEILLANWPRPMERRRSWKRSGGTLPTQCRYVEMLGRVWVDEGETRERSLRPEERLQFHQKGRSGQ